MARWPSGEFKNPISAEHPDFSNNLATCTLCMDGRARPHVKWWWPSAFSLLLIFVPPPLHLYYPRARFPTGIIPSSSEPTSPESSSITRLLSYGNEIPILVDVADPSTTASVYPLLLLTRGRSSVIESRSR